ncbi:MAG: hypothetical protein A2Z05_04115 [Chloroflexi bacterium RBG_16_60_22]|nr:MAG: hypothetical protein A2Z05_04115 [Chloroflexi bacterium RBG_16_60_22]
MGYLKQAISGGQHWYRALLGAIGLWTSPQEVRDGRTYRYLIEGEAFDWLLLAERLLEAVDGLPPVDEKDALLFSGIPPLELTARQVRELIGDMKYGQYLNYFYGVTVEEALLLAVQEEIDKERRVRGFRTKTDSTDEAYQRIYGTAREALLKDFRKELGRSRLKSISLDELKEFTYWLFRCRLKHCEKAKIASDTKKALGYLKRQWRQKGVSRVMAADLAVDDAD